MEIKAGMPSSRGGNTSGRAKDYSIKALRDAERASVAQAEVAYSRFVSAWSERPKRKPTAPKRSGCAGATKEEPMPGIVTVAASPHHAPGSRPVSWWRFEAHEAMKRIQGRAMERAAKKLND